ncbi:unnamed protein product [Callosobruchus maculatus]|uniref:Core-binding (CB) domain-containing protein n=1 Tax=Callosobruchus maculatus TaxID=64391 RepID=A0A653CN95_CALMS|nr:unnamed protein product [Callosobruchus maculatus]
MHALRFVYGTHNICKNNQLDSQPVKRNGHTNNSISRRLSHCQPKPPDPPLTHAINETVAHQTGLDVKRGKIVEPSPKENRVLRINLGHRPLQNIPPSRQEGVYKPGGIQINKNPSLELDKGKKAARETQLRLHGNSVGATAEQEPTTSKLATSRKKTQENLSDTGSSPQRLSLVEGSLEHNGPTVSEEPLNFHDNGCVRQRLGCPTWGQVLAENLELSSTRLAYQQEGTVRCVSNDSPRKEFPERESSIAPNGQPNGDILYQEPGRHKIETPVRTNDPAANTCGRVGDVTACAIHSQLLQLHRRPPFSPAEAARLAFNHSGDKDDLSSLGHPTGGPVCLKTIKGSSSLCNPRQQRHVSAVRQRVQSEVVIQVGLGISSSLSDSASPQSPTSSKRDIHIDRPEMGPSLLAGRSVIPGDGSSNSHSELRSLSGGGNDFTATTKGPPVKFGSLENTGWSRLVENWNQEDIDLLQNSWRPSSLKTYSGPWKQWLSWASKRDIPFNNPSPEQVARYLAYLHREKRLAPATIKLHKSVITTFSNPMEGESTANNPLIKRIIKAIEVSKPQPKKKSIWNINVLVEWMKKEDIDRNSIFQVSRRVALILLLASGRRIHDLTLLRIDNSSMDHDDESISFWPEYGSKTDKNTHRQSGWRLLKASDTSFDPVFWINQLILVTQKRRTAVPGLNHLFITSRGRVSPASRSVIAGWVKTSFKEAGIYFPAGSIRSAVASARWDSNVPLDTILKKGNWKGSENCFKYYFKEVDRTGPSRILPEVVEGMFMDIP